jgi:hypothetical protein
LETLLLRRTVVEKQEDKVFARFSSLFEQPEPGLYELAQQSPILKGFIKKWESVRGSLEELLKQYDAAQVKVEEVDN